MTYRVQSLQVAILQVCLCVSPMMAFVELQLTQVSLPEQSLVLLITQMIFRHFQETMLML
jgi:hypothetical protein